MDTESKILVIVGWSTPNEDIGGADRISSVTNSIEQLLYVDSVQSFFVTERKAIFKFVYDSSISQRTLHSELQTIFGCDSNLSLEQADDSTDIKIVVTTTSETSEITVREAHKVEDIPELSDTPKETNPFRATLSNRRRIVRPLRLRSDSLLRVIVAFVGVYYLLLRHIFGTGAFPNTTDAFAHLFRVEFVANEWKLGNLFPLWAPDWYQGTPLFQYYGPMVTIVMAPLAYLGGITFAYQAFTVVCFAAACISVVVLFRSRIGSTGSVAAAVLYSLSPFVVRTIFMGGSLPATLVFALQPLFLWLLIDFVEAPTRKRFLYVAIVAAVSISTHQLFAAMFMSSIAGATIILSVFRANRQAAAGLSVAAIAIGIGLTSVWLFSAQTSVDFDNLPLPHDGETRFATSRSFEIFSSSQRSEPRDVYLGLGLVVVGALGFVVSRRREFSLILMIGTAISIFMTFGMNNPIVRTIPLLDEFIFFERFLLSASLFLALLSGVLITELTNWTRRMAVQMPVVGTASTFALLVIPLSILLYDSKPYYSTLVQQSDQKIWVAAAEAIDQEAPEGRIADLVGRPEPAFFSYHAGRESVTGWFLQGTSHWEQIGLLNHMVNVGHTRFANRQYQQWWTTGAYAHEDNNRAIAVLQESGFIPVNFKDDSGSGIIPWVKPDSSSIINELNRNSVVTGRAHTAVEVVFPWTNQSRSGEFSDISKFTLKNNKLLILAEANPIFENGFEDRVNQFRAEGGVVLAVLGNDDSVWKAGLKTSRTQFPDSFDIVSDSGDVLAQFSGLLEDVPAWEGIYIDDPTATTLLRIEAPGGFSVPLLSRYDDDSGDVYILGAAYYNMVFSWPDRFTMDSIENELKLAVPDLSLGSGLSPLTARITQNDSRRLAIDVHNPGSATTAIISTTYAPHWKSAVLDGKPVSLRDYERLIAIDLPTGSHTIELTQGLPSSYYIGFSITLGLTFGLLAALWKSNLIVLLFRSNIQKLKYRFSESFADVANK